MRFALAVLFRTGSFALLFAILVVCAPRAWAQDAQTGFPPFGSFQAGGFDAVNLENLNSNFSIPIVSLKGRGIDLNFAITYNTSIWRIGVVSGGGGAGPSWVPITTINPGWNLTNVMPGITWAHSTTVCHYGQGTGFYNHYNNYVVSDPTGTVHSFAVDFLTNNSPCPNPTPKPRTGYARDNSGYFLDASSPTSPIVYTPTGTKITEAGTITDSNGNELVSTLISDTGSSIETDYSDTLGRVALKVFQVTSGTPSVKYETYGPNGAVETTSVNFGPFDIRTNFACPTPSGYLPVSEDHIGNQYLPISVVYPNGEQYTFTYESTPGYPSSVTARVKRATLPTGGYYEYDYPAANDSVNCAAAYSTTPTDILTEMTRTIYDGSKAAVYTYTTSSYPPNPTTTTLSITSSPADSSVTQTQVYSFDTAQCGTAEKIYQGSTLLRTITTTPAEVVGAPPCAPSSVVTTLEDEETQSEIDTTWFYTFPLQKQEYGYGLGAKGALLRTTNYTYLNTSAYAAANILNRVTGVTVTDGVTGQVASRTDFSYDDYSPTICVTGAPGHDDTAFPCTYNTRGNATTITQYADAANGTSAIVRQQYYDSFGNLRQAGNANCTQTTWIFSATTEYGYPDSVVCGTSPSLTTSYTYDFETGLVDSITDPNLQKTSYSYDALKRPLSISFPDTGSTAYSYNDSAHTVTETRAVGGGLPAVVTEAYYDELGRQSERELVSDPAGADLTVTTYDALSRTKTVTNPYRTTSDATYGITTYSYDILNRTTAVTNPDNTSVQTSYSLAASEVTDEGNGTKPVQKILQSDALGRVISVCEVSSTTLSFGTSPTPAACGQNISGTGFLTSYSYDALADLLSVSQSGLNPRTFTYDSLSRLTGSTNPESGTIAYTYDANSNVVSKVSPKPNQTSPSSTVTTTYSYDDLNRLTQKSYSDGTTPTVNFVYDEAGMWNIPQTNPIGRMTEAYLSANSYLVGSIFGYDPVGRVVMNNQCPNGQTCPASGYPVDYTYDLIGDVLTSTNGHGVTLTYGYNSAAQVSGVTSSLSDANHPSSLLSGVLYNAPGGLTYASMGTVTSTSGISENRSYNNRLRTVSIGTVVSTSSGNVGLEGVTYGYAPNGDVTSLADGPTGNWSFKYDDFNRLLSTTVPNFGTSPYAYGYDRYGNRWQQTANGSCAAGTASCITFDANNRVAAGILSYDAAGNVTADNMHHYTYDAENRLIQVDAGATASYTYDAFGHRVRRTANGVSYDYVYDLAAHAVAESTSSGVWDRGEVYLPSGRHLATYVNGLTYFSSVDGLGSERVRSTENESSYESCVSLPFGDGQSCFGPAAGTVSPLHFTGQERDSESSLDNFKSRYMSSGFGRFMSPDPVGNFIADLSIPQSWDLYSYVMNNPLAFIDPTGLDACYWSDGTHDDSPEDGGAKRGECEAQGGTWIPTLNQSISVNGNNNVSVYWSDIWIPTESQPQQQEPQEKSYAQCVKEGGDYFSLQNGLRNISGGHLGNGWLSGTFLGNPFSSLIQAGQNIGGGNVSSGANDVSQAGGSFAVSPIAKTIPNVTFSVVAAASVSVQTPAASTTANVIGRISASLPLGTFAQATAETLDTLGYAVTLPVSVTATSFAAVVCSVGR